jgi:hypothetical protein
MDIDYSAYLPEPTPLRQAAIVEFTWGPQHFRILCVAADVRTEPWETGEAVDWLHFKGIQFFDKLPNESDSVSVTTYMVPARYVTRFDDGPAFRVQQGKKTVDIGVFPPQHESPAGSIGVEALRQRVAERLTAERN